MVEFLTFFILIITALLFSSLFTRFHVPWVITLIIAGIVIGPFGLGILEVTPTAEFLGQIGIVFLMFMAGMEIKLSRVRRSVKESVIIAIVNGLVPFIIGMAIANYFGYSLLTSIIVGSIFISSSIAAVLPTLESKGLIRTKVGTTVIASTLFQDIFALLVLAAILQFIDPTSRISLPIFILIVGSSIVLLRWAIPKLKWLFNVDKKDVFEKELRLVLAILIGTVAFYELIGLHSIVAGFIVGLMLSDVVKNKEILNKIHSMGYGLFIPIFFIILGSQTDIGVFWNVGGTIALAVTIIMGSMLSKYFSGVLTGRLLGFTRAESSIIGSTSIPQLSTTLATVFIGTQLGLIDHALSTSLIILSIVTTMVSPILINATLRWFDEEKIEGLKESRLRKKRIMRKQPK